MKVCLLTCDARHSAFGDRIAPVVERLGDATIVTTGDNEWPGAVHIDELSGSFDAAVAIGWRPCLHVFRVDAEKYAYYVPAMQDAQLWHGDERRLLAALTYDLPLTLIAANRAIAKALEERAPGRQIVVVEPGIARAAASTPGAASAPGPLRVASAGPADEILARASEPVEAAGLDSADVLLALVPADTPLTHVPNAMFAGVVPIVTPFDGHDELVTDGENGIVVGFDDVPGTARALDTLARDRDLLARLREAALQRAASLPTPQDAAAALTVALEAAPPATDRPQRLLLNARAVAAPIAEERRLLEDALRSYEERIERLTAENERLTAETERRLLTRVRRKLS
jgi:hypothetical protein